MPVTQLSGGRGRSTRENIQGHLQLYSKFEASLDFMRPSLRGKGGKWIRFENQVSFDLEADEAQTKQQWNRWEAASPDTSR